MKLLQRKKKDESIETLIQPEKRRIKTAHTFLLAGLLLLLATFAAAAFLLFGSQQSLQQQALQQQKQAWSAAFLGSIAQTVSQIELDTKAMAQMPSLVAAVNRADSRSMDILSRQLRQRAHAVDVFINLLGQAETSNAGTAPLNFAALELINNAERGSNPPMEFFSIDNKKYLYKAVAIVEPSSNSIIGSLLAVYDGAMLLDSLPALNSDSLQASLSQRLPGAPELKLFSQGQASSHPETFATAHPRWTFSILQDSPPLQNNSSHMLAGASLLLGLIGALLALLVGYLGLNRQISTDCNLFSKLVQDWQMGKSLASEKLRTPALRSLITSLSQTSRNKRVSAPAVQPVAPPVAENNSPAVPPPPHEEDHPPSAIVRTSTPQTNPLTASILEDDILDIDILDEDQDPFGLNQPASQPGDGRDSVQEGIFRAYDIRGIAGENLTTNTAYWIGRAVGSESIEHGQSDIVIARDGRLSSPELSEALALGLTQAGCDVIDIGMVPTPVLYFATHNLSATSGVMLTGSHNPANYNGFKIVITGETLSGERIHSLYQRIRDNRLNQGNGQLEQMDILPAYVDRIRNDVVIARPMKVVIDCGNGVASVIAQQLFTELGCEVIPLFCEVDGNFPNHHPDPGKPENLQSLIASVRQHQADIGIAFDGDADRLGVVTSAGKIIHPDHLMMLLSKDMVSRNPGADIVFDIKCSRRLGALISGYGGRPVMWKTGHSLMKAKLRETGALLAGEMSGHIFYSERWYGFDDGLYSAARMLEIIAMDNRTSEQIFAAFPTGHATPELSIPVTENSKLEIMQRLQETADWGEGKITTLDGIRVDYPKSWGLVRASNTTPTLVLRFEGDTEDELHNIMQLFRSRLEQVNPDLQWPTFDFGVNP